jgi:hypothetical protein
MKDLRTDVTTDASRAEQAAGVAFGCVTRNSISHRQVELARAPLDYLH